jgi:hypothetical protein
VRRQGQFNGGRDNLTVMVSDRDKFLGILWCSHWDNSDRDNSRVEGLVDPRRNAGVHGETLGLPRFKSLGVRPNSQINWQVKANKSIVVGIKSKYLAIVNYLQKLHIHYSQMWTAAKVVNPHRLAPATAVPLKPLAAPTQRHDPLNTKAPATHKGYKQALEAHLKFQEEQGDNAVFKKILEKLDAKKGPIRILVTAKDFADGVDLENFKQHILSYCTFLVVHKHDGTKHFACDTQLQYLSGFINCLSQHLKSVTILQMFGKPADVL